MELIDKAQILTDVWDTFGEDADWQAMFEYADLGFHFAYGFAKGHILQLSPSGEGFVEEAWDYFCEVVGVDSGAQWKNFDHVISKSTNFVEA